MNVKENYYTFMNLRTKEAAMKYVIDNPSDFEDVNEMYLSKLLEFGCSLTEILEALLDLKSYEGNIC